jgi:hypothetical protein
VLKLKQKYTFRHQLDKKKVLSASMELVDYSHSFHIRQEIELSGIF